MTLLLETAFDHMPGLFGVFDQNSRYIKMNHEGARWLGFKSADEIFGLCHLDIRCEAQSIANRWMKQDKAVLTNKDPQKFIGFNCYASRQWRLVLGEKKRIVDTSGNELILCHYSDISNLNIFDISPYLPKHNGKLKKQQVTLNICKQFPLKNQSSLSIRQSECLYYLIRGYPLKQISEILNLSVRTIESHVDIIKDKFTCYNKSILIAMAIDSGYLNYIPETLFCS